MRINFVYEKKNNDWTKHFVEKTMEVFSEYDVEYIDTTFLPDHYVKEKIMSSRVCDVWYCFSFYDRWLRPIKNRAINNGRYDPDFILCHNHGGMETHDLKALFLGKEDTTELPRLLDSERARILFNTKYNMSRFTDFYRTLSTNLSFVGYPIDIRNCSDNYFHKRILVPGRFCDSKQTMLAAEILLPFRDITTFCSGTEDIEYENALKNLGFDVFYFTHDAYISFSKMFKVGFTASRSDSLNVSIAEMRAFGSEIVCPDNDLFSEIMSRSFKYSPYSIEEARGQIEAALDYEQHYLYLDDKKLSTFSFSEYQKRLCDVLSEVEECV